MTQGRFRRGIRGTIPRREEGGGNSIPVNPRILKARRGRVARVGTGVRE